MPERAADLAPENISTLDRLVRSIDMAEGFALFIARCNVPVLRNDLILTARQQLAALGVAVVEVAFEDRPVNVRERVAAALAAADVPGTSESAWHVTAPKRAIFVTGLELGIPYDQPNSRVLAELNLGRDAFLRDAPHPLVLWLPDYAVTAVARFAPDFWAWRSGVFEFEADAVERRVAIEHFTGNRPWHTLTNLSPEVRLLRRRQLESLLDDYRDLPDEPRAIGERAVILIKLGEICAASQDHKKAAAYYEQALSLVYQLNGQRSKAVTLTLNNLGLVYSALGEKHKALGFYEQALPLQRQVGDRGGEAATLNNIGMVYDALDEQRKALEIYEQALPLQRQVGDRGGEAATLNNIGVVYDALDEQRKALEIYEQALLLSRQVGDRGGEATTLNNIGFVHDTLGEQHKALDFYEQALLLSRQVGDRGGEAATLNNIGLVYHTLGEKRKALDFYEKALSLNQQVGDRWGESITRYNMVMVYEDLGDLAQAEEQLVLVVALDEAVGHPDLANHRAALERVQAQRRAAPGQRASA
jgi:tetratricopeptide (TPR) repeat protein